MQILEVKNNIAKIVYNPMENRLLPADFLLIEDSNQKLIAQITNIETTEKAEENLANLRLALTIDKSDNLSYYNGYIPAKTSKIIYITPDEIVELVEGNDKNIYLGNLSNHPNCFVKTNISYVDDNLYIQSDRSDKTQIIVQNLVSELKDKDKKIILIDFDGQYSLLPNVSRLKISENIKLPLNIEAFDTILEYDTVDCPIEDKAVIQSIVLELREYLKTLKDKFIPFNMFKKVVDDEFASNPVSGLMLLRNKLWLYSQDSIFADRKEQFDVIDSTLFNQSIIVIDASALEEKWYKFIIQTVASLTNHDCYLFLSLNDINIDKKSIMNLYNKSNIVPIVSTTYDSSYRTILKSLCRNQLLFKPQSLVEDQAYYTPLLNRMNSSDFILYGDTTLNLPLVLELQEFDSGTIEDVQQNRIKRDVDKLLSSPQTVIPKTANLPQEELSIDEIVEEQQQNNEVTIQDDTKEDKIKEEPQVKIKESKPKDIIVDDDFNDSDFEYLDEVSSDKDDDDDILNVPFELHYDNPNDDIMSSTKYDVFEPVPVKKINCDEQPDSSSEKQDTSTNVEVENEVVVDDKLDILDEFTENVVNESSDVEKTEEAEKNEDTEESEVVDSEKDTEIASIDDVIDDITSKVDQESEDSVVDSQNIQDSNTNEEQQQQESQNDDLVIEFEDDNNEQLEDEDNNDAPSNTNPPEINTDIVKEKPQNVPIYETDIPSSQQEEEMPFKIGDKVYHPKHGNGVIEGFANYSNKILFCQIDFENVGRRIMDPRVSGLEKVS